MPQTETETYKEVCVYESRTTTGASHLGGSEMEMNLLLINYKLIQQGF